MVLHYLGYIPGLRSNRLRSVILAPDRRAIVCLLLRCIRVLSWIGVTWLEANRGWSFVLKLANYLRLIGMVCWMSGNKWLRLVRMVSWMSGKQIVEVSEEGQLDEWKTDS